MLVVMNFLNRMVMSVASDDMFSRFVMGLMYNDIFDNLNTSMNTLVGRLQATAMGVIVLCIVIAGFMFFFGENTSRTAKKWLGYIFAGAILVFGATTWGSTIKGVSGF